ncbi:LAMI_0E10044g1_1 [Lachancea mirantina]|uniref:LAMI_0E10044g1_1 n=1 Tax=Lachancea mirantina TaxID=1230905 RepID=A0A1G4JNT8_9SACH|nr:LAMI_0E10044g1_1 [Lachancea mirantina]
MSDFWQNNKGSIMSGLSTAGKYGYKGSKAVAKAGYKAGKNQYNSSRGISNTDQPKDSEDSGSFERTSSQPSQPLQDVSSFPPPPVRPGQNQYHGKEQPSVPNAGRPTVYTPSHAQNTQGSISMADVSPLPSTAQPHFPSQADIAPPVYESSLPLPTTAAPDATRKPIQMLAPEPMVHGAIELNYVEESTPVLPTRNYSIDAQQDPSVYTRDAALLPHEMNSQTTSEKPHQRETLQNITPDTTASQSVQASGQYQVKPYVRKTPEELMAEKKALRPVVEPTLTPEVRAQQRSEPARPAEAAASESTHDTAQKGISGVYSPTIPTNFAPPPTPRGRNFTGADTLNCNPSRNISRTSLPRNNNAVRSSSTLSSNESRLQIGKSRKDDDVPKSAVVGSYNYDAKVNFQPPPKPFRRDEQQRSDTLRSSQRSQQVVLPSLQTAVTLPLQAEAISMPPQHAHSATIDLSDSQSLVSAEHRIVASPALPPRRIESPMVSNSSREHTVDVVSKNSIQTDASASRKEDSFGALNNELAAKLKIKKKAPPIPKKKESLKVRPPVPAKKPSLNWSPSLSSNIGGIKTAVVKEPSVEVAPPPVAPAKRSPAPPSPHTRGQPAVELSVQPGAIGTDENPFQRYLLRAVPTENDRLHK